MRCSYSKSLSPDWLKEKLSCLNPQGKEKLNRIRTMFENKFNSSNQFLTANELKQILVFKGLARSQVGFLEKYRNCDEVEKKTKIVFECGLSKYNFEDIKSEPKRREILEKASFAITALTQLHFVGISVASAILALAYPRLFGTVDYIVPGILHCELDDLKRINPLFKNLSNAEKLKGCLLLSLWDQMTPNQSRELAKNSYQQYIQELWNIKGSFNLDYMVADIEVSLWSYGICYLKKQKGKNKQDLPFRFQDKPVPPRSGLFAKYCPNCL